MSSPDFDKTIRNALLVLVAACIFLFGIATCVYRVERIEKHERDWAER
jgi:hypothetical protein